MPSLPAALDRAKLDWRGYADAHESYFDDIAGLKGSRSHVKSAQFDKDVARSYLPAVAWLYAPGGFSEHPPFMSRHGGPPPGPVVRPGQQWTADRVKKVGASRLWASTAIFITWDDWGGWYDHVDPPDVAQWKNDGTDYSGTQFRYGPRVPCLVVSPYAKNGYISESFHSHVSVVKFCLKNFGLPPLGALDAAPGDRSDDMMDCFDFAQTPLKPPVLPAKK
jgi:phospholipase C